MIDKPLEPWERYKQTAQEVWVSENDAYGRDVRVTRVEWKCMVCKQETTILDVDTSDGEYLSFNCCLPCFTRLIGGKE